MLRMLNLLSPDGIRHWNLPDRDGLEACDFLKVEAYSRAIYPSRRGIYMKRMVKAGTEESPDALSGSRKR